MVATGQRRTEVDYESAVDQLRLGGCLVRDGDKFYIRIGSEVARRLLRRPDVRLEDNRRAFTPVFKDKGEH